MILPSRSKDPIADLAAMGDATHRLYNLNNTRDQRTSDKTKSVIAHQDPLYEAIRDRG